MSNSTNQDIHRTQLLKRLKAQISSEEFDRLSLDIFYYQAQYLPIYKNFLEALNIAPTSVKNRADIPFLPIDFFKTNAVTSAPDHTQLVFQSSGTTGQLRSKHYVADQNIYNWSLVEGFKRVYGDPKQYSILALLPSYIENGDSSLVHMVNTLMELSENQFNGFYLDDFEKLNSDVSRNVELGISTLLIGVSFALLDFSEQFKMSKGPEIVIETGGMKGRRKEIIRSELHATLCENLAIEKVHSEYGMTELLSQAYSIGNGIFTCPPWMKVIMRDVRDPFGQIKFGKTGGVNIIDLANLDSCAFIQTSDLGRQYKDGSFEILGRFDTADVRGCNLLFS